MTPRPTGSRGSWSGSSEQTAAKGEVAAAALAQVAGEVPGASARGRGLVHGLTVSGEELTLGLSLLAKAVTRTST